MKLFVSAALYVLASAVCVAQSAPQSQSPAPQQPAPPAQPAPPTSPQQPAGKVIFSRSIDENGETKDQAAPQTGSGQPLAKSPLATDAERDAVTFTAYDLDVHLRPAERQIAVRAQLMLRNDGKTPLAHIPLQISSTLNWERIRVAGKEIGRAHV